MEINEDNFNALIGLCWLEYYYGDIKEAERYILRLLDDSSLRQESYNEVVFFYIVIQNNITAEKYNKKAIELYGLNQYNEGYKVILQIFDVDGGSDYGDSLKSYEKVYGETNVIWLQHIMEELRLKLR